MGEDLPAFGVPRYASRVPPAHAELGQKETRKAQPGAQIDRA
jgi:hypothetical protein